MHLRVVQVVGIALTQDDRPRSWTDVRKYLLAKIVTGKGRARKRIEGNRESIGFLCQIKEGSIFHPAYLLVLPSHPFDDLSWKVDFRREKQNIFPHLFPIHFPPIWVHSFDSSKAGKEKGRKGRRKEGPVFEWSLDIE